MTRIGRRPILLLGLLAALAPAGGGSGADCQLAWTTVPGMNGGEELNSLSGLAVVSDDDIWASGSYTKGANRHSLIQHWDGKSWNTVPSHDGSRKTNWLNGMTAVSKDDVWVVGYSTDQDVGESLSETLIQEWDGRTWNLIPSPNLTAADVGEEFGGYPVSNELFGIAAVSAGDIWAVGRSFTVSQGQELIIHWDGASWSVVPSPHPGQLAWLRGVVVVSKEDVWALGEHYVEVLGGGEEGGGGVVQQNLIEHWDGLTWSVVPSPNIPPAVNGILGGSAVSATDIWAVGYHLAAFGVNQVNHPTILHWDGVEWSAAPAKTINSENAWLFSVSAFSAEDVFAVGFYDTGPPLPKIHTLVEHWNGLEWSILPSADPGDHNYLHAAAAIFPDNVWAVGTTVEGEVINNVLIERYTSTCLRGVFLRGDSNADGTVNISDALATLSYLFIGGDTVRCLDALDADDDGSIVITDAIFVLEFLFQGAEGIPEPYPAPGLDPTSDPFDCTDTV